MTLANYARDLFNIGLSDEQVAAFTRYETELIEWNQHTNLTAITQPEEIQVRHFLDSLSIVKAITPAPDTHILDVGAGAGFPGLPLAIAFPQTKVTVMDSTGKKVRFMQHVIDLLELKNANAIQARAEEAGQSKEHRNMYDLVLARAVARLSGLVEYMLPLVHLGGHCIAMKGITANEEVKDARRALKILGGKLVQTASVELPGIETPHYLIMIKKVEPTPKAYPRRPGIPTRKPIE